MITSFKHLIMCVTVGKGVGGLFTPVSHVVTDWTGKVASQQLQCSVL